MKKGPILSLDEIETRAKRVLSKAVSVQHPKEYARSVLALVELVRATDAWLEADITDVGDFPRWKVYRAVRAKFPTKGGL